MSSADQLKALGNKAFTSGQFDEAIKHFTAAIAKDPSNHVLYSNRSASYASLKQFDLARADAEKTVTIKPDWAKGYSRLGAAHHGAGNLDAALDAYTKGLEIEPTNALLQKGAEDVKQALEASAKDPFAQLLNDGIWAKIGGNPKLAPLLADPDFCNKIKMLIANPSGAMNMMQDQKIMMCLLTLMGVTMTNSADEAADIVNQAEARQSRSRSASPKRNRSPSPKSRSAPTHDDEPEVMEMDAEEQEREQQRTRMLAEKQLGNDAYKKRDFTTALKHYQAAWELSNEQEVPILTNMAAVYFEQQEFQKCIESCEKAVEVGRELRADFKIIARALQRIGNAHVKLGDLEQAIKFYNKSLMEHRTPDTLQRLRDTEKALEQQTKASYHNPKLSDEARERGNALFKEQKFAEAVKEYTEAIKRNESDPRAYSNRATCYHKLGALPDAIKDCDAAVARDPKFVKAYLRKAAVLQMTKDHTKCLETLEAASKADGDRKHEAEIQVAIQKCYAAMYNMSGDDNEGMSKEERAKKAMQDPEVQAILADPVMQQMLQQMQQDPGAAREHMKNPIVAQKIRKLVSAGVLGAR
ncbi:stress-induced protein sti1-like protein [Catenaria anguillulae PL171]|uniref:Stress-induced protein sti1-like protein n=1 Tax=Catenaria anguillulae PL171 TaxID=765915 RepID=A0A1Y2I6V1_9FUNG|nr:stress-induced protein sti1-like protein [Catenaria anguillulae PL171]